MRGGGLFLNACCASGVRVRGVAFFSGSLLLVLFLFVVNVLGAGTVDADHWFGF